MVTIRIGADVRDIEDVDPSWIANQVGGRREESGTVCVEVAIQQPEANLRLATPACSGAGGGTRRLTALESEIVDLWKRHRLDTSDFSVGDLIAFVKQLLRLLKLKAA